MRQTGVEHTQRDQQERGHRLSVSSSGIIRIITVATASLLVSCGSASLPVIDDTPQPGSDTNLTARVLVGGLDTPWDLAMAPDGYLWVTERRGVISRVNTSTGTITEVGRVGAHEVSESGLMGIALHPDYPSPADIFAIYTYEERFPGDTVTYNRVVRMTFDGTSLSGEEVLLDRIPAGRIHDGARLVIGPDRLLYVTMGDAGAAGRAQDLESLSGKILRLALDGQPAPGNPFDSYVYSYGHRNPQGAVFHPTTGDLYVTEHGPSDNDEVNIIVAGGDFGWPEVHGYCDDDIGGTQESAYCAGRTVEEPIAAYTPTIAPSGMDYYGSTLIPDWQGSLLFTTLKDASLRRLQLSADGQTVLEAHTLYRSSFGRLRDVLVGPDGRVYLATSNRDGRGNPAPDDDRIIVIAPE